MLKPMAVDRGGGTWDGVFYFVEMQFVYMERVVLRMVVLPELSSPIMIILIYFLLQSLLKTLPKKLPMVNYVFWYAEVIKL